MRLLDLVNCRSFLLYYEDPIEALLEVGDEAEDMVILDGSFEGSYLLDKDLVEVALEILYLMNEIVFKEEAQVGIILFLQLVYLLLQQLFRTGNHLVELIQPLADMF